MYKEFEIQNQGVLLRQAIDLFINLSHKNIRGYSSFPETYGTDMEQERNHLSTVMCSTEASFRCYTLLLIVSDTAPEGDHTGS